MEVNQSRLKNWTRQNISWIEQKEYMGKIYKLVFFKIIELFFKIRNCDGSNIKHSSIHHPRLYERRSSEEDATDRQTHWWGQITGMEEIQRRGNSLVSNCPRPLLLSFLKTVRWPLSEKKKKKKSHALQKVTFCWLFTKLIQKIASWKNTKILYKNKYWSNWILIFFLDEKGRTGRTGEADSKMEEAVSENRDGSGANLILI